jgi:hypothetical protein
MVTLNSTSLMPVSTTGMEMALPLNLECVRREDPDGTDGLHVRFSLVATGLDEIACMEDEKNAAAKMT